MELVLKNILSYEYSVLDSANYKVNIVHSILEIAYVDNNDHEQNKIVNN